MKEYFVVGNSFAAPAASDTSFKHVSGITPQDAMAKFRREYTHPCGLYAAVLYENADDYHKGKDPIDRWLSEEAQKAEA